MVKLPPIINHAYLMVTEQCPLRCQYCYIKDRVTANEFPFEWMDKIKNMFTTTHKPRLIFFGGEPLVKLNLIERIVNEYNDDFQFQVVTNGCVNFKEFMERVYEPNRNKFDVQISWDGSVDTRKMVNGNSTFEVVYKNIIYELEKGRILVGRSVLNEESVKRFYDTYIEFKILNNKYKFGGDFTIAHQPSFEKTFFPYFDEQLEMIYKDIDKCLITDEHIYIPNLLLKWISNILMKQPIISCDIGNHVVIRPNGDVYPCTILSQIDERFKLGNLNDSIDTEIVTDLRYKVSCTKDCKWKSICDGGCRYERIKNFPQDWRCNVCQHTCDMHKIIFENTTNFLNNLSEEKELKLLELIESYNLWTINYDNSNHNQIDNQQRMLW